MPTASLKPNIIYIVLDTHRVDRIGCYGYPRGTTPNLDSFAQESTRYANAIAPAQWTIPSHASMFSGEPPSTHLTLHAGDALDEQFTTLAEHLSAHGYRTTGFSNNPLVALVQNGFLRGFQDFYNYCGAVPLGPPEPDGHTLSRTWWQIRRAAYDIMQPIQNKFSTSDSHLQTALNPFLVPLWTRFVNFKGNSVASIRDSARFIRNMAHQPDGEPNFVFINLMETHLPYTPPESFIRRFLPYYREERAARAFMRRFNTEALRWLIPMEKPFSELEARTLSDMYDAEVAYQDHLLAQIFEALDHPMHRENTMVIFVADHGEMLGEHRLMGHGFGAYQELIHVPMIVRYPGQTTGRQVSEPVSITRLYHTILDLVGLAHVEGETRPYLDIKNNSFLQADAPSTAIPPVSEAYAPENAIKMMEQNIPAVIDELSSRATNRAIYADHSKLLQIEDLEWWLFDLENDPREQNGLLLDEEDSRISGLVAGLRWFIELAEAQRPDFGRQKSANVDDARIMQRLRDLGYVD